NQITTSCGLAEKVYNAYRTDGIVTAISDRQAYEFRCFTLDRVLLIGQIVWAVPGLSRSTFAGKDDAPRRPADVCSLSTGTIDRSRRACCHGGDRCRSCRGEWRLGSRARVSREWPRP